MPDIFVSKKNNTPQSLNKPEQEMHIKKEHLVSNLKKSDRKTNMLSTYIVDPSGITFEDQEPDEKILLFTRRHFITNVDWILITLALILIPIIIISVNAALGGNLFNFINAPQRYIFVFLLFYYSAIVTFIIVNFISWFFNVGLITTRRVVDIDLHELIFKDISTTKYSVIQDVSYVQNGVIRSIFQFGDVIIQTAGQHGNFELEATPHPERVVHLIEDFIGKKNHGISNN